MPLLEKINASFGEDQQRSFGDYWQYSLIVWIISYDIVVPSSTVLAPSYSKTLFLWLPKTLFLRLPKLESLHEVPPQQPSSRPVLRRHLPHLCTTNTIYQALGLCDCCFFSGLVSITFLERGQNKHTNTHTNTHTQYIHRRL